MHLKQKKQSCRKIRDMETRDSRQRPQRPQVDDESLHRHLHEQHLALVPQGRRFGDYCAAHYANTAVLQQLDRARKPRPPAMPMPTAAEALRHLPNADHGSLASSWYTEPSYDKTAMTRVSKELVSGVQYYYGGPADDGSSLV